MCDPLLQGPEERHCLPSVCMVTTARGLRVTVGHQFCIGLEEEVEWVRTLFFMSPQKGEMYPGGGHEKGSAPHISPYSTAKGGKATERGQVWG